jgi:hypothetical protein
MRNVQFSTCEGLAMTDWVTIEHIALRGGPRDEDQLNNVASPGLLSVITVQSPAGADCGYRKSGEYSQLRGERMVEPYARIWFYDWLPDTDGDS